MSLQFHFLAFEGPDPYALAGGIGTRVSGLTEALADLGYETHLWFVGDPNRPGNERRGNLHLHRWCQWMSWHRGAGVYDGQDEKVVEYGRSLPPVMLPVMMRAIAAGQRVAVVAEDWHTVSAVVHLHALLEIAGVRGQVNILWNANNTFGFEGIDWERLRNSCNITTVSRYMKHLMRPLNVEATVIPNGLSPEAFGRVARPRAEELRRVFAGRTVLAKVARWDPDKRWLAAIDIVAALKRSGQRPLLVARGGMEAHGGEVLASARAKGLQVRDLRLAEPGPRGLVEGLARTGDADVIDVRSHLDWEQRRLLYRESAAVLANSGHEPFGLVGLEAMAVGGLACTGCSGEDYAVPGHNALVLESGEPAEFLTLFANVRDNPEEDARLRAAGKMTAKHYAWPGVVRRALLPRVRLEWPQLYAAPAAA